MPRRRTILQLSLPLLACIANAAFAEAGGVTVYPPVGYDYCYEFEMEVNGKPVRVDEVLQDRVAFFEFEGRAEIVVRVPEPIRTCRISPLSYGIVSDFDIVRRHGLELSECILRFSLDQPRRLVVTINDLPRLFIWAEGPEKDAPRLGDPGVVNVLDFGAHARDCTPGANVPTYGPPPSTEAIRRAIEAVPAGGVLYFPPGLYVSGTIRLKSNMTMYLAAGSRILGSPLRDDYPKIRDLPEADVFYKPTLYYSKGRNLSYRQFILVDGAENVAIRGRGVIDGNGEVVRPQGFIVFLLKVIESRNVRIEDIVMTNSPSWGPHYLLSSGIVQRNTKQVTNFGLKYSAGPTPDASSDVLIEDNFAACRDDYLAVKITGNGGKTRDAEDITVRRNVIICGASTFKIGTEVNDGHTIRNVEFSDNDVIQCDRGMSLYLEDGGLAENIRYVNNRFERPLLFGTRRLIHFYIIENSREEQIAQHGKVLEYSKGRARNVLIKDCVALERWPSPSTIEGLDADHRFSNVRIENLVIAGKQVREAGDIPLESNSFVEGLQIVGPKSTE